MVSAARGALAACCAALLVASATLGGSTLGLAAPFSGDVYGTVRGDGGGKTVESPYGPATVRYDDDGVPHVTADSEAALYYAAGYVQARDRLFQMDLQRRLVGGRLAAAFGPRAVASDRFHRRMDFRAAANASWRAVEGTPTGDAVEAYTAGVNRYVEAGATPPEFELAGYEPRRWRPADTLLVGKLVAWRLSGGFADLRAAVVRERVGPAATALYPDAMAHDSPVIRGGSDAAPFDPAATAGVPDLDGGGDPSDAPTRAHTRRSGGGASDGSARATHGRAAGLAAVYESVAPFDRRRGVGSNNWVVSGAETATGRPVLANDPHLSLSVPAVWYEMHLRVDGDGGDGDGGAGGMDVRGVTFPGVPFVVIGRTADVAWGVTNVGGDVTDHYTYETRRNGSEYRYRGEWRAFETTTERVPVAGAADARVTVRKSVHGPVVAEEGRTVGVAWPGFSATNESVGVYRLNHADRMGDVVAALAIWDVPAQNFVAATRAGETLYYPAGRYPVRRTEGAVVGGDRVFDGSAGAGAWRGYTPYGRSNWSGFAPFESIPHVDDPTVLASANQRVVDDPPFYVGTARTFASPYRGARIYDRLDARVASADPVDAAFARELQRDVHSTAADQLVPHALAARERMAPDARALADDLAGWDRRMTRDSRGALVYRLWRAAFVNATLDEFRAAGLGASYDPPLWVLGTLPADSRWFDDRSTRERETRADVAALAMNRTADRVAREGYGTYGDWNRLDLDHPFGREWLSYPERAVDGSEYTVKNVRTRSNVGSSWRMVVAFGADRPATEGGGVIPGGQSGVFWSEHYHDQLPMWAEGEYRTLSLSSPDGPPDLRFVREGSS
jgi:penicillin amidase